MFGFGKLENVEKSTAKWAAKVFNRYLQHGIHYYDVYKRMVDTRFGTNKTLVSMVHEDCFEYLSDLCCVIVFSEAKRVDYSDVQLSRARCAAHLLAFNVEKKYISQGIMFFSEAMYGGSDMLSVINTYGMSSTIGMSFTEGTEEMVEVIMFLRGELR